MQPEDSRVGVRELRQNLSVYLDRVKAGETFRVTEHGHPVAIIAPLPESDDILERLIAEGQATRPKRNPRDLPRLEGKITTWASEALEEQRAERL